MKKSYVIKPFVVIFLILGSISCAYSQRNFLNGYVVTTTGDTLHGQIDYRNWNKNPKKIDFKQDGQKTITRLTPLDIQSFRVNDEHYLSAIVQSSVNSRETGNLSDESNLSTEVDTTFLQALVEGDKSLYFNQNHLGINNFYIKYNNKYVLLVYNVYKIHNERESFMDKRYIGQLSFYFKDTPSLKARIEKTDYDKASLSQLFLDYYNQSAQKTKFQKKVDTGSFEFGVVAGITSTQVQFAGGDYFDYLAKADLSGSVNPTAGLFLNYVIARGQGKFSSYNELIYCTYKTSADYQTTINTTHSNSKLGFGFLSMNNMIRLKYPVSTCFIFINGGITTGIAIHQTNQRSVSSTYKNINEKALDDVRNFEFGYIGGIGLQYHRYSVEARYKRTSGPSRYAYLNSPVSQYFFVLEYRF